MDEMKSALDRAMERADKLGKASEEEQMKWKYIPEGERIAVAYMTSDKDTILSLDDCTAEARPFVIEGAQEVLIKNIDLPRNDATKANNLKAMDALKEFKRDKAGLENVYSKIMRIFTHYEKEGDQQRKQAYEDVKRAVEAKIMQTMQQKGQPASAKFDVEKLPQFIQEWHQILTQLDSQYVNLLNEYKQEIRSCD